MLSQELSDDECRFIHVKRLVTEYIPPVLRQLFVLRWNERHPDDKWDDSDGARRDACGKKLLEGSVKDVIEVPSCTVKLSEVHKDKGKPNKGFAKDIPLTKATITIEKDSDPPINLYRYAKNGVAVVVVQEDGSPGLPGTTTVDKIVSSRQLVVVTPSVPNPLPQECGGLRLRTPRVLPPANDEGVNNPDAQDKIKKRGLDHWDVTLLFWALTDNGRRLVDSPTTYNETVEYRLEPNDKPLYEALKAVKDIRNQKYGHSDGCVDEKSWTEVEKEVLKLCEVLDGEFAKMLPERAADGKTLAKLRTLVTRDHADAMYHVKFFEQSELKRVASEAAADLEAQTSKMRWMQQSPRAGSESEEATLQEQDVTAMGEELKEANKAMGEELMEANKVRELAVRVGCEVGELAALDEKISQAGQYLEDIKDKLTSILDGQGRQEKRQEHQGDLLQQIVENTLQIKQVVDRQQEEKSAQRPSELHMYVHVHVHPSSTVDPTPALKKPRRFSTRPIVPKRLGLSYEALSDHDRGTATSVADRAADSESTASSTSLSTELIDPQGPVRTLLTLTLEGELETFVADTFKEKLAERLEMQPESIEIEMVEKSDRTRGQGLLSRLYEYYILRSGGYRVCVRVDKDGYLEHVDSISSGSGSSSEQSDANADLELLNDDMRDDIKRALRRALSPRRKLARTHIDIQWIKRGSVIVCIELDLPYALKLLELVECKDATLDEMHISRCVIGEEGGEEGGAPASACNPHDAAIEVTEAEASQFYSDALLQGHAELRANSPGSQWKARPLRRGLPPGTAR